jgi:hypothetical protein
MPFDIGAFRSALTMDGARPNLFDVEMPFPTGITLPSGVSEQMNFFCRAAQLPGSTVNQVPLNYFGRELKFAGNRIFTEWTVTIINDEDFKVRNAFEAWMNGLNSHRGNLRSTTFTSPTSYTTDATVKQYGKTGDIIKDYKFIGMFPMDISPIEVDWAANDTIEEYAVTFAYQWWESNETRAGPPVAPVVVV